MVTPKWTKWGHGCMHTMPPLGSDLCTADTYKDDIINTCCHWQDALDNCYQFKTSALFMYSRWGIPKDSLKPQDVTLSMCHLFTGPPSRLTNQHLIFNQPTSVQYLIRPHPPWSAKLRHMSCFLHSDSGLQTKNMSHSQLLFSSM